MKRDVYDPEQFSYRVDYAAQCFMRGIVGTRHFDTCFEMFDGDLVVAALCRRAAKNPRLHQAIANQYQTRQFPQSWLDTAAKFAQIATRKLRDEAKRMRAATSAALNARYDLKLA